MSLSHDLISQFVKITNDRNKAKVEKTVYGTTVERDGSIYVRLDGATTLTPVKFTANIGAGERVMVQIKNHTATVTGNLTSPAARVITRENGTKIVEDIDVSEFGGLGDRVTAVEELVAKKVSTDVVEAISVRVEELSGEHVSISGEIEAAKGDISDLQTENVSVNERLTAAEAVIDDLNADALDAKYAKVEDLEATNADVYNLESTYAEFVKTMTEDLDAAKGKIDDLETKKLSTEEADLKYATVEDLEVANGKIDDLETEKLSAEEADLKYATIENFEVETGRIDDLETKKLSATEADIKYATVENLTAATGRIGILESDVASIDTLIFGSASGTSIHSSFANAVIAQLGKAQITSAMIESVSADQITTGDIITNNVQVKSSDGKLLISDETIQISDDARVRVQIGKDADNDYSINIWDEAGNLMFSKGGITDSAIKKAIIRDDMVKDDANISASKLDIDSLFTEINGSSKTIKSTKVYLDEQGQTLDVSFTAMSSEVNGLRDDVQSQGTDISVMKGQISSKVWEQDIETAIDDIEVGGRNLFINSSFSTDSTSWGSTPDITTIDGVTCGHISCAIDKAMTARQDIFSKIQNDDVSQEYTFSADIRADNIVTNATSSFELYFEGAYNKDGTSAWLGATTVSGTQNLYQHNNKGWVRAVWTVRFAHKPTRMRAYIYTANCTGDLYFKNLKLEKGNKATDWTPAPEDIEGEVTTLNTKYSGLEQTAEGISAIVAGHTTELSNKAGRDEVTAVSDRVTNVEISLDGFRSTVSETYSTKADVSEAIDNIEVGGRNLLKSSNVIEPYPNDTSLYPITKSLMTENDRTFYRIVRTNTASNPTRVTLYNGMPANTITEKLAGKEVTFSFLCRASHDTRCTIMHILVVNGSGNYLSSNTVEQEIGTDWTRVSRTVTVSQDYDVNSSTDRFRFSPYVVHIPDGEIDDFHLDICEFKIELGNKATDWTPAPEDVEGKVTTLNTKYSGLEQTTEGLKLTVGTHTDNLSDLQGRVSNAETNISQKADMITLTATENRLVDDISGVEGIADDAQTRVTTAESLIQQLANSISMLVTDENGTSLMKQNSDGVTWSFSIESIQEAINDASEKLDALQTETGGTKDAVDELTKAVNSLGVLGEYIKITTYEDEPCIELGEADSNFKVLITNTRIMFLEGSDTPTYLSNRTLISEKIEVKNELHQSNVNINGSFVWSVRANGNYGLMWKEG